MNTMMSRRSFGIAGTAVIAGLVSCLVGCGTTTTSSTDASGSDTSASTDDSTSAPKLPMTVYSYAGESRDFTFAHSNIVAPAYYVYAGEKTQAEADQLVSDLGLQENIDAWGGTATVINPIADAYGPDDNDALKALIAIAATNVKVIGIEEGATFVNNVVSQNCFYVAGIMTVGGEMDEGLGYDVPVPAYLSAASKVAVDYYTAANATDTTTEADGVTLHSNSAAPLQNVAVHDGDETLAEAFGHAWEHVFRKNYRECNYVTEFYDLALSGLNFVGEPLEGADTPGDLLTVVDFDTLDVDVIAHVNEAVDGVDGEFTWYEYVPRSVKDAERGTVPLVVSLHGNNNDPRINADSTGWIDVAAAEGLIVVSPEWQMPGHDPADPENEGFVNATGLNGLGDDGVLALVKQLQGSYPQIDSSRVYASGLSAGGAKSLYYGVKYNDVFAAVAVFSGVNNMGEQLTEASETADQKTALLYLCGDHDQLGMIPVDGSSEHGLYELTGGEARPQESDPNTHIWPAIQAYQRVNGLEVVADPDMSANEYYGLALENTQTVKLGTRDMVVGSLSDDQGEIMRLGAIKYYPHWNYEFEGPYAWDFVKTFSRDMTTGELVRV